MSKTERVENAVILTLCLFLVPATGWAISGRKLDALVLTAFAVGALLLVLILGSRAIAGSNRRRIATVFGPLVRVVLLLLSVSVVAQGGIIAGLIYARSSNFQHTILIVLVLFATLVVAATLLASAFSLLNRPMPVRAKLLEPGAESGIYEVIGALAKRLGASAPQNILIGLSPTFYVTQSPISLPDKEIVGSTLFLSLPLMRRLTTKELYAVVGHELGHFRGEDTYYSSRFAPTYSRIAGTLSTMDKEATTKATDTVRYSASAAIGIARLPADVALRQCWIEFAIAERGIGRDREFVADQAGVEVSSPRLLATALLKSALYAPLWSGALTANMESLEKGDVIADLSDFFDWGCARGFEQLNWEASRENIAECRVPHPIDTHPPIAARLEKLGIGLTEIDKAELGNAAEPASALLSDADAIGAELTVLEGRFLVESNLVRLPNSTATSDQLGVQKGGNCYKCGAATPDGATQCPECGATVSATAKSNA